MSNTILKAFTATAVVLALASFAGGTSAQEKKAMTKAAPKPPACSTIKTEAACTARADCTWIAATTKGKITLRRARCGVKAAPPPAKKEPATKTK